MKKETVSDSEDEHDETDATGERLECTTRRKEKLHRRSTRQDENEGEIKSDGKPTMEGNERPKRTQRRTNKHGEIAECQFN
ncbi:hypothetical protein RUM43_003171 [Polyplax serrata]|uniref:Uncharacterized protein n=1 Tax=Polyplax serrata TaxID=468196 RepID=A0AAN8NUV6_POLSC